MQEYFVYLFLYTPNTFFCISILIMCICCTDNSHLSMILNPQHPQVLYKSVEQIYASNIYFTSKVWSPFVGV